MAIPENLLVKDLKLDLENFRTVHQPDEQHAVNTLIAIRPNYFWGLMESLLEDGYNPTENIIVMKHDGSFIVKEGNRRIASLKIIHGIIKNIDLPEHIEEKIAALTADWKTENQAVPCAIYTESEEEFVDRLVSRTHGKGETSGRDQWNAVARARHARDHNNKAEPALDLLEAYLQDGKNLNPQQAERWSGDYPLTVLEEAAQKLAPLLGCKSPADLASQYPKKNRKIIEDILFDIGTANLTFPVLRATLPFWGARYGLLPPSPRSAVPGSSPGTVPGPIITLSIPGKTPSKTSTSRAFASNDPRAVRKMLKAFKVHGSGREKIRMLFDEIKTLKLETHPHAFCFLLRSIFELSAKAYCDDHKKSGGPSLKKNSGEDKHLADVLREIVNHLTKNKTDKEKLKILHGAITELGKNDGILSVTSLNQLIHNRSFSIAPPYICLVFGNVFPLLEEMNG
jgi:hypothetical protein